MKINLADSAKLIKLISILMDRIEELEKQNKVLHEDYYELRNKKK